MNKKIVILFLLALSCQHNIMAQRKCGMEYTKASLLEMDPAWAQKLEDQRASLQGIADAYKANKAAGKSTTTASPVPVIFHILVTYAEYDSLGGTPGIARRVDSQIAVLNRDYNAQNGDSTLIPSGWKHLYGNPGIQFALAHTDPLGFGSPGFEIKIIPDNPGGFTGAGNNYRTAKHLSSGGFDSWNPQYYMNVWCLNFVDVPGLLGVTVAKSFTTGSGSGPSYPPNEEGICMYWEALGKRVSSTDYYPPTGFGTDYFDQGRTLTHETGHFFEIWHTWGDDGNYSCPWNGAHKDDGLADTPPEGGPKFYNNPYTIAGGTFYDTCRFFGTVDTQGMLLGVACLDFMNYTDDVAMHMFTTDQAAVMSANISSTGEHFALTQSPGLLTWSVKTGVSSLEMRNNFSLAPNPTSGKIGITFDPGVDDLKGISVFNTMGQLVYNLDQISATKDYYSIDLSAMSNGIYFVRCNFASATITRKITIQ